MLTARGYWFLVLVAFLLALGVVVLPDYTVVPAILGLTLFAWFAWEWVMFRTRVLACVPRMRAERRLVQGGREVPMVWAGLPFEVRLCVAHDGFARLPFVFLEDRLPQAADLDAGSNSGAYLISAEEPANLTFTLKAPGPGVLRFEGVRVRVADVHGFFHVRRFLRDEVETLILPPFTDEEGRQRADKRMNTLPPPGGHRLRRPGSGSELLDLRDYIPGDPPKMIAWKASARRDRLITKEYESDVPVRAVLFLDTSEGVRLGPPGTTPLARMAALASGVAQAAAANRDLVGLTTFDEEAALALKPARTRIHMLDMMRRLAEAAALQPTPRGAPPEQLTRRAYPLAEELYPELTDRKLNTVPLSRLWLPMLERWWGWIVLLLILSPVLTASSIAYFGPNKIASWWIDTTAKMGLSLIRNSFVRRTDGIFGLFLRFGCLLVTFLLPSLIGGLIWLIYGVRGWFGAKKVELVQRKRLCAVMAQLDGTGVDAVERLVHDDAAYAVRVGKFLADRQIRVPVPLYDDLGRFRFRSPGKVQVLAAELVRAVSRARDNELYVILADLAELGPDLGPLEKAARVARARKHHVMVILPWPADLPGPDDKPTPKLPGRNPTMKAATVLDAMAKHYHEQFRRVRRALGRSGATVIRVNETDPVRVVLDRLDRLRGLRTRR
ncbi:DUF58 domain-containing protein [Urbifossiella limnaea]|uniref:DUF58 domain-containing protein n=1 Tax=Urbifossiella limnaea TaxID=2528023 RepID=A0A517XVJ2_9BACT|nr:DUF58 domain-containing protein [Urbifossiella limnaea]QDU21535.1 hypothetical protein ETAA1_35020 [Urbifossiella limnaea]